MIQKFIARHKDTWTPGYVHLMSTAGVLFLLSLVVNHFASIYASESVSLPVTDIILSNIRVFDVDVVIVVIVAILFLLAVFAAIKYPHKVPFAFKAAALFLVIRSVFISLTHLGPFSPHVIIGTSRIFADLGLGYAGDLFFSGHTGMPFLIALIVWEDKTFRLLALAGSIGLGASVLLGHLHYSIDVFAAYFITYTIFEIAKKLFAKDWELALRYNYE